MASASADAMPLRSVQCCIARAHHPSGFDEGS
jgi:hypothetical protein